jgi:hypothetical protein
MLADVSLGSMLLKKAKMSRSKFLPARPYRTGASEKIRSTPQKTFFNSIGHLPPRQSKRLAAAIPLITDAKADDWRGGSGPVRTFRQRPWVNATD